MLNICVITFIKLSVQGNNYEPIAKDIISLIVAYLLNISPGINYFLSDIIKLVVKANKYELIGHNNIPIVLFLQKVHLVFINLYLFTIHSLTFAI